MIVNPMENCSEIRVQIERDRNRLRIDGTKAKVKKARDLKRIVDKLSSISGLNSMFLGQKINVFLKPATNELVVIGDIRKAGDRKVFASNVDSEVLTDVMTCINKATDGLFIGRIDPSHSKETTF